MNIVEKRVANVIAYQQKPEDIMLIGDRYLVQDLEVENVTDSGLVVLDGPLSRAWQPGLVVKVGNGHRLERNEKMPMFFKTGDVICFERLSGREVKLAGKPYRIVNQTACFWKFDDALVKQIEVSNDDEPESTMLHD